MHFDYSITIPFSTRAADYQETLLKLANGVIHRVEIDFPFGCAGLAHVQLFHQDHQLWPQNVGGSYNYDDGTIAWDDRFELVEPFNVLKCRTWNLDDTFDHTPELRFSILPRVELEGGNAFAAFLSALRRLLRL